MESGVPAQISFGFGMGFCCGFAAKKTAKVALVGVGLAFGSLQVSEGCAVVVDILQYVVLAFTCVA